MPTKKDLIEQNQALKAGLRQAIRVIKRTWLGDWSHYYRTSDDMKKVREVMKWH